MKNNKALVFLALVFLALFSYWTFEQINYYRDKDKSFENLPDTISASTENTGEEGIPSQGTQKPGTASPSTVLTWTANDYKKGDITGNSYTVKSGDTLWEIAEGVYGDGMLWTNILAANSSQVGFLPNGQQALIFPGQALVIP